MRIGGFAKVVALLLVLAMGGLSSGCFGKFQLTRKAYEINQAIDEQYVRSAATWVFVIAQVYTVCGLVDFLVFNLIEFWTGENPVASGPVTKVYTGGDERVEMTIGRQGDATVAVIERFGNGRLLSTLSIRDDGKGVVTSGLSVPGGETVRGYAAALPDGSVETATLSGLGAGVRRHPAAAVEAYRARAYGIASRVRRAVPGGAGTGSLAAPARLPAFRG